MRSQRAKPRAQREVSGVFPNFERSKLKERQKMYQEHIDMKCSKVVFFKYRKLRARSAKHACAAR